MMAALMSSLSQLPFIVASCVLGGFASWGWRRTRQTGALLIVISSAISVLHQLLWIWSLSRMYTNGVADGARMMTVYGMMRAAGSMIAEVLFIVGFVLIVRRLPRR